MKTSSAVILRRRILVAAHFTALCLAGGKVFGFAGGDGSPSAPFQVASAEHLDAARNHLGAHFLQTADIDLGGAPWNEGGGWVPLGASTAGTRFTGSYDGGGFTIANLTIQRSATSTQGLFGYLDGASVRGVVVTGAAVTGVNDVGILAGRAVNSMIEDVRVSGAVTGTGAASNTGGLAGYIFDGRVHRVWVNAVVQGNNLVGGLAGYLTNHGEIRHSSVRGSVAGNTDVGGLVGQMYGGQQFLSDCYSRAATSGNAKVGGLVGFPWAGKVYRCYSSGAVSGPEGVATIGGLIGLQSGDVRDSFWDVESSGRATSGGGTGLSTLQMQDQASFQNFNFHSLWAMEAGGYPVFRDFSGYAPPAALALGSLAGDGSAEAPYILTNASELNAMRQNLAAHYRLGNNIDLRDAVLWDMGRGWSPVGVSTTGQRFTGTLDGAGFKILNLALNRPPTGDQGLFGYIQGATLRDLRLEQANLQGGSTSGLLAGQALSSTLEQVSVQGQVRSGGSKVGGLAGEFNGGALHRADANVEVQGTSQVGGLAGYLTNHGEIRHCSARGSVGGGNYVGGLVGQMLNGSQYLSDCYSRAAASGNAWVGGLVGYQSGAVYRCYSSGAVSGPEGVATIGGLTGQSTNVRDSFWDVESSGRATSAGGTGLTTLQMQDPASFQNFNFHSLWAMEAGGYPVFRDFSGYAPPAAVALGSLAGDGSAEDPYILANASELNAMRQDLGSHYRLGNNIDLRDAVLWDMGRGWSPVGVSTTGQRFTGTLDGAGFKILNLALNRPPTGDQGLFGYIQGATLRDLRLEQANLQGGSTSGLLAGQALSSTIEQVSVQGLVRSGGSNVGGLAGFLNGGATYRGDANVVVQGATQVGALAGYLTNGGQIHRSSARGSVGGGTDVGGLVGQMYNGSQVVNDCYSRAAVTGENRAGGLVGYIRSGNVSRSYATGLVSAASPSSGNLGGLSGTGANVQSGYWDVQTSGQSQSGGGAGRGSAAMTHPHASDTYVDWDFAEIWAADADGSVNGGYPYLRTTGQNPQSGGPFTLVFQVGAGGSLAGPTLQVVAPGATASAVRVLSEPGAVFTGWSDGSMANPRGDQNVSRDIQATARFQSAGGVDIDWYAGHGIAPGEGQTWSDLDSLDWIAKGMTLQQEFIAGTDPNDPLSRFDAEPPVVGPGGVVTLAWSSVAGKTYGIKWSPDLEAWHELESAPGAPLRVPAAAGTNRTVSTFDNPADSPEAALFFLVFVDPG
jgi:hypothetical protein